MSYMHKYRYWILIVIAVIGSAQGQVHVPTPTKTLTAAGHADVLRRPSAAETPREDRLKDLLVGPSADSASVDERSQAGDDARAAIRTAHERAEARNEGSEFAFVFNSASEGLQRVTPSGQWTSDSALNRFVAAYRQRHGRPMHPADVLELQQRIERGQAAIRRNAEQLGNRRVTFVVNLDYPLRPSPLAALADGTWLIAKGGSGGDTGHETVYRRMHKEQFAQQLADRSRALMGFRLGRASDDPRVGVSERQMPYPETFNFSLTACYGSDGDTDAIFANEAAHFTADGAVPDAVRQGAVAAGHRAIAAHHAAYEALQTSLARHRVTVDVIDSDGYTSLTRVALSPSGRYVQMTQRHNPASGSGAPTFRWYDTTTGAYVEAGVAEQDQAAADADGGGAHDHFVVSEDARSVHIVHGPTQDVQKLILLNNQRAVVSADGTHVAIRTTAPRFGREHDENYYVDVWGLSDMPPAINRLTALAGSREIAQRVLAPSVPAPEGNASTLIIERDQLIADPHLAHQLQYLADQHAFAAQGGRGRIQLVITDADMDATADAADVQAHVQRTFAAVDTEYGTALTEQWRDLVTAVIAGRHRELSMLGQALAVHKVTVTERAALLHPLAAPLTERADASTVQRLYTQWNSGKFPTQVFTLNPIAPFTRTEDDRSAVRRTVSLPSVVLAAHLRIAATPAAERSAVRETVPADYGVSEMHLQQQRNIRVESVVQAPVPVSVTLDADLQATQRRVSEQA